jgi:mediator of RNA polymerase II transcription subunit 12
MNALQKIIAMRNNLKNVTDSGNGSGPESTAYSVAIPESAIAFWFSVLLRLTAIHRAALTITVPCKGDQTRLLIAICGIALSPMFSSRQNQACALSFYPYISQGHRQGDRHSAETSLQVYALDIAATLADTLPDEARQHCARILRDRSLPSLHFQNDTRLLFLLGPISEAPLVCQTQLQATPTATVTTPNLTPSTTSLPAHLHPPLFQLANPNNTSPSPFDDPSLLANRLRFQQHGRIIGQYTLRAWEMLEEPAPIVGVNDTALNLGYFGARQIRG